MKSYVILLAACLLSFIYSAGQPESGAYTDTRDGQEYKWVKVGEQVWMAENLKYLLPSTDLPLSNNEHFADCGLYYTYAEAREACPPGWHLPSDQEWMEMEMHLGMKEGEAKNTGWRGTHPGQATALLERGKTGMDISLCGQILYTPGYEDNYGQVSYYYKDHSVYGFYWTATSGKKGKAYFRMFYNRASIYRDNDPVENGYSVRCVRD